MASPIPKPAALRQRRNKVATNAVLSAEIGKMPRAPVLPKLEPDSDGNPREWHRMTRAWWKDVWHSPMISEYLRVDLHGLYRLAVLIDKFWNDPSTPLAAEIRLQQQCFGLTPIDRRRLQWEVERVEEVTRKKRHVQQATEPMEDPRKVLRVLRA